MPSIYGYLRLCVNEQNVQSDIDQLKSSGAIEIFKEKGLKQHSTKQLDKLMSVVQEGDTVVVTSLDRIAHNTRHLSEIIESLFESGVTFKAIKEGIDTSSSHGEVIRTLLDSIVEFERKVVRERQAMGIAKAKREGRYKGRKPTARAKSSEVMALNEQGLTRQKIADELGIGVASVYRILKTNAEPKKSRKQVAKKSAIPIDKQKQLKRKPNREADDTQLSFF